MTRQELNKIISLEISINSKTKQLIELKERKHLIKACNYTQNRVKTSITKYRSSNQIIEKICDLEMKIQKDIDELIDLKDEARIFFKRLDSPMKEIMELRYINNMKWEEIAKRLHYTQRTIFRLHKKALSIVSKCQ